MTTLDPNDLRKITSFEDVIEYLTGELDWPIDAEHLDDATFDWDIADELGLPSERVPHLASLRQLRPMETNQPWGIFFLALLSFPWVMRRWLGLVGRVGVGSGLLGRGVRGR